MTEHLLANDVDRYCLAAGIQHVTALQYRKSETSFSAFLRRPAVREDLTEEIVNRWLGEVRKTWSACTARNRKRGITPVWNWLAQTGAVPFYNPRALMKIRVPKTPPRPWSIEQVGQLLAGARDLDGRLNCGVAASDLMQAWVLVAYETALRPSDLYRLRWEQLAGERFTIVQHKTGGLHSVMISPETAASLDPLRASGKPTIFILGKHGMRRWELALFRAAGGHGFTRCYGQSSGTLRKTAATILAEGEGVQSAADLLGHVSGTQVTRDSYIGPDALGPTAPPIALIDALRDRAGGDRSGGRSARSQNRGPDRGSDRKRA